MWPGWLPMAALTVLNDCRCSSTQSKPSAGVNIHSGHTCSCVDPAHASTLVVGWQQPSFPQLCAHLALNGHAHHLLALLDRHAAIVRLLAVSHATDGNKLVALGMRACRMAEAAVSKQATTRCVVCALRAGLAHHCHEARLCCGPFWADLRHRDDTSGVLLQHQAQRLLDGDAVSRTAWRRRGALLQLSVWCGGLHSAWRGVWVVSGTAEGVWCGEAVAAAAGGTHSRRQCWPCSAAALMAWWQTSRSALQLAAATPAGAGAAGAAAAGVLLLLAPPLACPPGIQQLCCCCCWSTSCVRAAASFGADGREAVGRACAEVCVWGRALLL